MTAVVTRRFARRTLAAAVATAALLGTAGTATAAPGGITPKPFNTAAMAKFIKTGLGNGNTVGYAYAVSVNGKLAASGAGGKARTGPDGSLAMTPTTRMEIASATKNFTAVAVLKLLEANHLTVNTPVKAYLPATFKSELDSSWNRMSFKDLLTHTSGLKQLGATLTPAQLTSWSTLYPGLRFAVNQPIARPAGYAYSNMNFAMLRLTIPALWRIAEPKRGVNLVTASNSGVWALAYVNERLLAPAGIKKTSCIPATSSPALAYNASNPAAGGTLFQLVGADFEACAGHRGLQLSAVDLDRWQAHLAHGTIVSAAVRKQMDAGRFGWSNNANKGSNAGIYWHGGDLTGSGSRQLHTCHAKFPGGVEASIVMNSQNLGGPSQCTTLINAYKAGRK